MSLALVFLCAYQVFGTAFDIYPSYKCVPFDGSSLDSLEIPESESWTVSFYYYVTGSGDLLVFSGESTLSVSTTTLTWSGVSLTIQTASSQWVLVLAQASRNGLMRFGVYTEQNSQLQETQAPDALISSATTLTLGTQQGCLHSLKFRDEYLSDLEALSVSGHFSTLSGVTSKFALRFGGFGNYSVSETVTGVNGNPFLLQSDLTEGTNALRVTTETTTGTFEVEAGQYETISVQSEVSAYSLADSEFVYPLNNSLVVCKPEYLQVVGEQVKLPHSTNYWDYRSRVVLRQFQDLFKNSYKDTEFQYLQTGIPLNLLKAVPGKPYTAELSFAYKDLSYQLDYLSPENQGYQVMVSSPSSTPTTHYLTLNGVEFAYEVNLELVTEDSPLAMQELAPDSLAWRSVGTWSLGVENSIFGELEAHSFKVDSATSLKDFTGEMFVNQSTLVWAPKSSQSVLVSLSAQNPAGQLCTQEVVLKSSRPPKVEDIPLLAVWSGCTVTYSVEASDPDGDSLSFHSANITHSNVLELSSPGTGEVQVTDDKGFSSSVTFTVEHRNKPQYSPVEFSCVENRVCFKSVSGALDMLGSDKFSASDLFLKEEVMYHLPSTGQYNSSFSVTSEFGCSEEFQQQVVTHEPIQAKVPSKVLAEGQTLTIQTSLNSLEGVSVSLTPGMEVSQSELQGPFSDKTLYFLEVNSNHSKGYAHFWTEVYNLELRNLTQEEAKVVEGDSWGVDLQACTPGMCWYNVSSTVQLTGTVHFESVTQDFEFSVQATDIYNNSVSNNYTVQVIQRPLIQYVEPIHFEVFEHEKLTLSFQVLNYREAEVAVLPENTFSVTSHNNGTYSIEKTFTYSENKDFCIEASNKLKQNVKDTFAFTVKVLKKVPYEFRTELLQKDSECTKHQEWSLDLSKCK